MAFDGKFVIVRCFACKMFQVTQRRKAGLKAKFNCSVCHEKQSMRRLYASSDQAKELRPVVMSLNTKQGECLEGNDDDFNNELEHGDRVVGGADFGDAAKGGTGRAGAWNQFVDGDDDDGEGGGGCGLYGEAGFDESRFVTDLPAKKSRQAWDRGTGQVPPPKRQRKQGRPNNNNHNNHHNQADGQEDAWQDHDEANAFEAIPSEPSRGTARRPVHAASHARDVARAPVPRDRAFARPPPAGRLPRHEAHRHDSDPFALCVRPSESPAAAAAAGVRQVQRKPSAPPAPVSGEHAAEAGEGMWGSFVPEQNDVASLYGAGGAGAWAALGEEEEKREGQEEEEEEDGMFVTSLEEDQVVEEDALV